MKKNARLLGSSRLLLLIMACLLCTSCTYKEQFEHSDSSMGTRDEIEQRYQIKAYGFLQDQVAHHEMSMLEMDFDTASEVSKLDGVTNSFVLLTDRDAYIAIVLDNAATGTDGRGRARIDNNNRLFNNKLENKINQMEAKPPYYINDMNRRYTIPNPKDISSKLKQRIAEVVRNIHPEVSEVFISANEHFNNQLQIFAQKTRQGKSLDPYIEHFQDMARMHFIE